MSDPNETIADIVREIRAAAYIQNADTPETVIAFANRIEEAYNREHAEWHGETNAAKEARNRIACKMRYEFAAKCRACKASPGDAAAMREALEFVLQFDATDEAAEEDMLTDAERIAEYADHIEECQKKARAALAAPARNCDVGTAEEQAERFRKACKSWSNADDRDYCSYECPIDGNGDCHERFGQMPFAPAKGGRE